MDQAMDHGPNYQHEEVKHTVLQFAGNLQVMLLLFNSRKIEAQHQAIQHYGELPLVYTCFSRGLPPTSIYWYLSAACSTNLSLQPKKVAG